MLAHANERTIIPTRRRSLLNTATLSQDWCCIDGEADRVQQMMPEMISGRKAQKITSFGCRLAVFSNWTEYRA